MRSGSGQLGAGVKSCAPALVSTPQAPLKASGGRRGTKATTTCSWSRAPLVPGADIAPGTGARLRSQLPGPEADFQPRRSRQSTAERQPKAVLTVGSRLDGPLPEPQVFRLGHLRGCSGCQHGAWRAPQALQRWALCAGPPTGCPTSQVGTQPGGGTAGWVGGAAPGSSHSGTMPHRARAAWPSLGPYRRQSPPSLYSSHCPGPVMGENSTGGPNRRRETGCGLN